MTRLGTRVALAGLSSFALAVVAPVAPASAASDTVVSITFSDATDGQSITSVGNAGSGTTDQSVVTANGGALTAHWSHIKSGLAARYPAYDGTAKGARAVVAVTNAGSTDVLSPGSAAFTFGADAKLDDASTGTANDNGNNLVQRGLATQTAQYKLQLDGPRFSCRVKGDDGTLMVTSTLTTRTKRWYHATCSRRTSAQGDSLVLRVRRVHSDGTRGPVRRTISATGPVGSLTFAADTPFSVGGKLQDATTVATPSDQWNGVVDSAFLRVSS